MYEGSDRLTWNEAFNWARISSGNWEWLCQHGLGGTYEYCISNNLVREPPSLAETALATSVILGSLVCGAAIVACVSGAAAIVVEAAEFAATGSAISTGLITAEVGIAGGAGLTAAGAAAKLFCSFSGDTRVLMADGTSKEIADIEVGDEVAASDPETGESGARKVTHLWPHRDDLVLVRIDGETLKTTEDHPAWNASDHQWQRMDELDVGDALLTPSGRPAILEDIEYGFSFGAAAYDLTVDDLHTYYVLAGNTPVLVHNDGGDDLVRVGRWMSQGEFDEMSRTGVVQRGGGGYTYVVHPANPDAYRSARPGSVYAEFDVPRSSLIPGGRPGDYKMSDADTLHSRLAVKKGGVPYQLPGVSNIAKGGC